MQYRYGALFDMDGVIIDNSEYHTLAYEAWCKERNVDFDRDYFEKHHFGKQNRDILRSLLGRELSPDEYKIEDEYKEELYRKVYADHVRLVDGLSDFLQDLKSSGFGLAVATSGPPENVAFILEKTGLDGVFDVILTAREVSKGKPDPQVFLMAAEGVGVDPSRCVVFEDSVSGARAAVSSGAVLIGVATGHSQLDGAARMIKDFTEITADQVIGLIEEFTNVDECVQKRD